MFSVIVPTYNRPDALQLVLQGYQLARGVSFELIVADDGSTEETAKLVAAMAKRVDFPLHHVWHEDRGFRAAAIRNLAVRRATGDVLVFADGDCIPHPDFLAAHARVCRRGWASSGYRFFLSPAESDRLLRSRECSPRWLEAAARRARWPQRLLWMKNRWYTGTGLKIRPKFLTANVAVHRLDFEEVNGFDERFQGWGYEDEDLARRLRRIGIRLHDVCLHSLVYHLFHYVHESHRPSVRGSANRAYFLRNSYLTAPLRGLRERAASDLRFRFLGDVPESLQAVEFEADPEVIVQFTEGHDLSTSAVATVVVSVSPKDVRNIDELYGLLTTQLGENFKLPG